LDQAAAIPATSAVQALAEQSILIAELGDGATAGLSLSVRDLLTGEEIYGAGSGQALTPASTIKVLTAAAALTTLGPEAVFTTSASLSRGAGGGGTVTLVAGGDTTLAPDAGDPSQVMGRAGLGDLARAAAIELRRSGLVEVNVALDDTIFTGPSTRADWGWSSGTTWGAPATPLAVLDGRAGPAFDGVNYVLDPALVAAQQFAALLAQYAKDPATPLPPVSVVTTVQRAGEPARSRRIAAVDSAPLGELVGYMLRNSDNTLAEAIGRVVALARGQQGSFAGCAAAVTASLTELGLATAGLRVDDCSGLSHDSRVSAGMLTGTLVMAGGAESARLGDVARSLPVGGLQGTLAERFAEAPGAGNIRAKTGTLTGVTSLAGMVQTSGGRQLVFAVLVNADPPVGASGARLAMDRFVEGLAGLD
jgi:D-alanyl-D-alanine carboxypeptidase/D-alanyl-D-alanine-endopeptidase (penicillin-binding protein 4)